MRIPYKIFVYSHSGYCSGGDNAIEQHDNIIEYSSKDELYSDILNNTNDIREKIDFWESMYFIDNTNLDNYSEYIIKFTVNDSGSGYCSDSANHFQFINDKHYDIIKEMKIGDGYIIF